MLSQQKPVSPPIDSDGRLVDYSSILQDNLRTLFQSAHVHIGLNGVLTAAPVATDGQPGDILLGVVSGTAYIFIKTDRRTWWQSPAFTQL